MKKLLFIAFIFWNVSLIFGQGFEWKVKSNGTGIVKDYENNLYVFAQGNSTVNISKYDTSGVVLWSKIIATGAIRVNAYKIDLNNDLVLIGNITGSVVTGNFTLTPNGQKSFFLIKVAPNSNIISANIYGSSIEASANDIFINKNGDYVIGGAYRGSFNINGTTISGDSMQNIFIAKLDNNENVLWFEKSSLANGDINSFCDLNEIVETNSGKYYMVVTMAYGLLEFNGYTFENSGQYLMQLDPVRNVTWTDFLGYPGLTFNTFSDIQTFGDTVYIKEYYQHHGTATDLHMWPQAGPPKKSAGIPTLTFNYQIAFNKIYFSFETGKTSDSRKFRVLTPSLTEVPNTNDAIYDPQFTRGYYDIQMINEETFYVTGYDNSLGGFFAAKYNSKLAVSIKEIFKSIEASIYPNPSSGHINITSNDIQEISIRNVLGTEIKRKLFATNINETEIDLSTEQKGIYFIEIISGGVRSVRKIITE